MEIGRRVTVVSQSRDPLIDARRFLAAHGETGEGRALRKVMTMLATMDGEFSEAEIWLFSAETLALIDVLANARVEGRYAEVEWWAY